MSNYARSIDLTAKDALSPGDPNKVIKGSEIDAELDLVGAASTTKTNKVIPGTVGNIPKLSSTGDLEDSAVTLAELQILDEATVTTAELNILDGVTSTTAELNILDGVTSTTAELNTLDGITATVTELNYTDGVTSAIQTQLGTKLEAVVETDITWSSFHGVSQNFITDTGNASSSSWTAVETIYMYVPSGATVFEYTSEYAINSVGATSHMRIDTATQTGVGTEGTNSGGSRVLWTTTPEGTISVSDTQGTWAKFTVLLHTSNATALTVYNVVGFFR